MESETGATTCFKTAFFLLEPVVVLLLVRPQVCESSSWMSFLKRFWKAFRGECGEVFFELDSDDLYG